MAGVWCPVRYRSIVHWVAHWELGDSPLGLLALTLALASTGMGMAVGSLARTRKQAGNIGMVLGFVLFFASGLTRASGYLSNPAFQSGGLAYYLALLTPQAHAFDGYMKLMLSGGGLADVLPNMLALVGFGVVFFLSGLWQFKHEYPAVKTSFDSLANSVYALSDEGKK